MPSILLAGCGDIALRLTQQLSSGFSMTGLRRHPESLPLAIRPLRADVCDAADVARALHGQSFDYVVITLTPGERTPERYREVYVEGTRNLLRALHGEPKVLFVSSTSVYGQHQGEWVDEQSVAAGDGFSGQTLLEAEQLVMASGLPGSCIRFSGIYGPGRERLIRMVREGRVDPAGAIQFSNRIHADDAARVLAFLIDRWQQDQVPSACYVASDTCPAQSGCVWQWLAAQMEAAMPPFQPSWQTLPPTGKRCSSARLQSEGFTFYYPDYRVGYGALMAR